jgi:5,10-methenyltetrahydrofolate synthetase
MCKQKRCADPVSEIMQNKSVLRQTLLAARRALTTDTRRQWDQAICNRVLAWWSAQPAQVLGVYWPMRGEPDLGPAYAALAARGARLALPVVADKHLPLQFSAWTPGDALAKDVLGLTIPEKSECVSPDAVLIPCVGFNQDRFRLGYGGGFYDRTLAASPRPLAIGIAYACSFTVFDPAPHDVGLDRIITEAPGDATEQNSS